MIRVAADVTPLLTPRTGIGVFVGDMLAHVAARPDVEVTGYAVTWRGRGQLAAAVPAGVQVADDHTVPMAARPLHQLWMRADWPRVDRWIGRHDVVWGTNYVVPPTRSPGLVSVYDLTPLRFPQLANEHTRTFPGLIRRALRRGAWIHTMSQFVRDEIVDHFDADPERVRVVAGGIRETVVGDGDGNGEGGASAGAAMSTELRARVGERYVLALGTVEPRKDLPTLVAAFDQLAADHPDLRLVIAGADGWGAEDLTAAIDRAKHSARIVRIGWVEESDRPALMAGAAVYAYPSIYEGFGLPPLEAMTVGVPVVATRAGSLPEVCRDGADLVAVGDATALASAIDRVLADDAHCADLVRRGHAVAASMSWDRAAAEFADLLHEVAAP